MSLIEAIIRKHDLDPGDKKAALDELAELREKAGLWDWWREHTTAAPDLITTMNEGCSDYAYRCAVGVFDSQYEAIKATKKRYEKDYPPGGED